ncbi:hypothetical protein [Streptomyces sp. TR06-5]|uniref:hypothetical protein n=1 Tax=Streptomyces sp. TR06-5 TaxID=3385976 RepID=UPI0039A39E50
MAKTRAEYPTRTGGTVSVVENGLIAGWNSERGFLFWECRACWIWDRETFTGADGGEFIDERLTYRAAARHADACRRKPRRSWF